MRLRSLVPPLFRTVAPRVAVALAALTALACGEPAPEPAPEAAATPAPASRIVSLTPALTETLFALGLGDRVVGVTTFCDYPPEVARLPKVGGYADPDVEAVLALRPDLVLVSPNVGNREGALALRRTGLRVEVVQAETLEETFASIEEVGRLCGAPDRGRDLSRSVRVRVEAAAASVRGLPPRPALFCLQVEPLIAAGRGTLPSELMELAGGRNVVPADRYPQIAMEAVVAAAPETILQTRMDAAAGTDPAASLQRFWRRWTAIPAVARGRVFVFDGTPALRPGPRVGAAVEQLARYLHPEARPH